MLYNYLNTVYNGFEKSNLPIEEARPHHEFLFCTLRAIDVFTDAGIRSHGLHDLHFINLGGISSPLYIHLASRCRYRGCGIRSKIRDGVFRIRDFFHPVRHQQTCGNKLKSESGKLRIWGFRMPGFCAIHFHIYENVSCTKLQTFPTLDEYFDKCRCNNIDIWRCIVCFLLSRVTRLSLIIKIVF